MEIVSGKKRTQRISVAKEEWGAAVYERDGGELAVRGLFLGLPAWGYHVFELRQVGS